MAASVGEVVSADSLLTVLFSVRFRVTHRTALHYRRCPAHGIFTLLLERAMSCGHDTSCNRTPCPSDAQFRKAPCRRLREFKVVALSATLAHVMMWYAVQGN